MKRLFADAVVKDPSLIDAWGALIRIRVQLGRYPEARTALDRARAAGMPAGTLSAHEALIAAATGDFAVARRALERVPPQSIAGDPSLADIVRVTEGLLARAGR